jgi:DNA-binding MarR family transcriptional regulator
MDALSTSSNQILRQAVDTSWETFVPFWQQIRAHIRQVATEQFDISVEQFHILRLVRRGKRSVSELADARNLSRPAVSQAVEALVQKGLIARLPDSQDRRYIWLVLTSPGNILLDAVFDDTHRWMMQALTLLSNEESNDLVQAMDYLRKVSSI